MPSAGLVAKSTAAAQPAADVASHRALPQRGPAIGNQTALRRLGRAAQRPLVLQPKLEVGAVDDPLEHEADAVADRVMRMPDAEVAVAPAPPMLSRKCAACEAEEKAQRMPAAAPILNRKCEACEEEEDAKAQRMPTRSAADWDGEAAPASVHGALASPGTPLNRAARAFFEPRFGHDLSDVRVHSDARAAESAHEIGARAYTVGADIVFASGAYAPASDGGRRLIAHELAHVMQQTRGAPRAAALARQAEADDDDFVLDLAASGADQAPVAAAPAQTRILRRQDAPPAQDAPAQTSPAPDAPDASAPDTGGAEHVMTRPEEIAASQTSDGEVATSASPVTISLFNFAIDSAALKPKHRQVVAEIGKLLGAAKGGPQIAINATGNADATGTPAVNTPLSEKRAEAVQGALQQAGGSTVTADWHGEDDPVATNDTVEGRSRNRRVDIVFTPPGGGGGTQNGTEPPAQNQPSQDSKDQGGGQKPKQPPPGGDDGGLCSDYPILCALAFLFLLFCLLFPTKCLPSLPTGKRRKACVDGDPDLPSGVLDVDPRFAFANGWEMKIDFKEDDPATAAMSDEVCSAACGEYRQKIKGFFEIVRADGTISKISKALSAGTNLDPDNFLEDGDIFKGPFGHRFVGPNRPDDKFEPEPRATGPKYRGTDAPGPPAGAMSSLLKPGDTYVMQLDFQGGPVDNCLVADVVSETTGTPQLPVRLPVPMLEFWHSWTVRGSYTMPGPGGGGGGGGGSGGTGSGGGGGAGPGGGGSGPPGPGGSGSGGPAGPGGGGTAGPGGGPAEPEITPRPYTGPIGPPPPDLRYIGGLGTNPVMGPATIHVQFKTSGQIHRSSVPVEVTRVAPESVTIRVAGSTMLNVAPPGEPDLIFVPGRTVDIPRRVLIAFP